MKVYITLKHGQPVGYREHSMQHLLRYVPSDLASVMALVNAALCSQQGGPFNLPVNIYFDKESLYFATELCEVMINEGVNKVTLYPCE